MSQPQAREWLKAVHTTAHPDCDAPPMVEIYSHGLGAPWLAMRLRDGNGHQHDCHADTPTQGD